MTWKTEFSYEEDYWQLEIRPYNKSFAVFRNIKIGDQWHNAGLWKVENAIDALRLYHSEVDAINDVNRTFRDLKWQDYDGKK